MSTRARATSACTPMVYSWVLLSELANLTATQCTVFFTWNCCCVWENTAPCLAHIFWYCMYVYVQYQKYDGAWKHFYCSVNVFWFRAFTTLHSANFLGLSCVLFLLHWHSPHPCSGTRILLSDAQIWMHYIKHYLLIVRCSQPRRHLTWDRNNCRETQKNWQDEVITYS